ARERKPVATPLGLDDLELTLADGPREHGWKDGALAREGVEAGQSEAQVAVVGGDVDLDPVTRVGAGEATERFRAQRDIGVCGRCKPEPLEQLTDRRAAATRVGERREGQALVRSEQEQRLETGRRARVLYDPPAGGLS